MPALAMSRPVNSGMLATSVASATTSPSQRATCGRALPAINVATPPKIGNQINTLNNGQLCNGMVGTRWIPWFGSATELDQHGKQADQAEDHRERIVVEEAGLGVAKQSRGEIDEARAAVDEEAVDHFLVAGARYLAEPHAATGEAVDPQRVEAVLVLEHANRPGEQPARLVVQLRLPPVHHRGEREAGERQPECRRHETVQRERDRTVELFRQLADHVVRG